jgi:hypothetical protein
MRKRTLVASLGAAGALTLTGIGVAIAEPATPTPTPSTAAPDEDTSTTDDDPDIDDRRQAIEQALGGLVEDGTLTQDQVGRVADELDDSPAIGHHWWWGWDADDLGAWDGLDEDFDAGWQAAADALGMSVADLENALEDGKSLADVAGERGVETQAVTDALVQAAQTRIQERVADGSLTQEQADDLNAEISDWVSAAVDNDWWAHWGDHDHD